MQKVSNILSVESSADYSLLDSGEGEKLERFGKVILSRPDPQAVWAKRLSSAEWKKADGHFSREESGGKWSMKHHTPAKWEISFGGLKFWIKPTAFKHTGLFPEQEVNWRWLSSQIEKRKKEKENNEEVEVLNLFGYTGGATLACAQAGAKVVHIDSSKAAITWARENAESSGLKDAPIRWILEDARVFVEREIKRGRKYHGIIMDPPAFGHGPTKELWKIEEHFLPLVEDCKKLLADKPLFFLINGYSAGYSAVAYENMLVDLKTKFGGDIEIGELTIVEGKDGNSKSQIRLLPAGIFARWAGK
jgi:23S rRNA (cytosine1962-C5)-methyltransferase